MLGMGAEAQGDQINFDLVNAGNVPVTELPGASYFHHADSFAMMRGGHLDVCVHHRCSNACSRDAVDKQSGAGRGETPRRGEQRGCWATETQ